MLTDACAPLIAMYQAIQSGWRPRTDVTVDERDAALALPDTDPMKAFLRFGCGFGGNWSSGFARGGFNGTVPRNHAAESARRLDRDFAALPTDTIFECVDFMSVEPFPALIYADPPYAGTTGYPGAAPFDSVAFAARVLDWAAAGAEVWVSEFEFPCGECVLEFSRSSSLSDQGSRTHLERLYRVRP